MITKKDEPLCIEGPPQMLETGGSPGNNNPAVLRYDPSGLRSTMSANQEALAKSLASHAADHMPTPLWQKDVQDIIDECKAKGIPMVAGKPASWAVEPHENKKYAW